jgi:hypothetical protein
MFAARRTIDQQNGWLTALGVSALGDGNGRAGGEPVD